MTTKSLSFTRLPVLIRVVFYFSINYGLMFIAQMLTGFFPAIRGAVATNLLLALLLIIFTGIILKIEKRSWEDIGCVVGSKQDLLHLCIGTIGGVVMLLCTAFTIKLLTGFRWEDNPSFEWPYLLTSFVIMSSSVFVQELAFRGYTFRLMIERWGEWPAQLVTAFFFGLMHLSAGMAIQDMLLTMFTTGIGSVLFGLAVIKTKRLHAAIGIHFGWNYLQNLLPRHPSQNGTGIWVVSGMQAGPNTGFFIWVLSYVVVIIIAYMLIHFFLCKGYNSSGIAVSSL